jgi:hypothetical protein
MILTQKRAASQMGWLAAQKPASRGAGGKSRVVRLFWLQEGHPEPNLDYEAALVGNATNRTF